MSRFKFISTGLILLLISSSALLAQERIAAESLFQWVPMGAYRALSHAEMAEIAEAESYPLFKELFGNSSAVAFNNKNPLPEWIQELVESQSVAQVSKIEITDTPIDEEKAAELEKRYAQRGRSSDIAVNEQGEKVIRRPTNTGGLLWTFRFEDTDTVVKDALEKGELARSGLKFNELPVYKLVARDTEESQKDYFAYVTPTNELLLAEDLEELGAMIKAGMGFELGVFDEAENAEVLPYLRDLSHSWQIVPNRVKVRERIESMRLQEDLEDKIREMEENIDTGLLFEVQDYRVGESLTLSRLAIYGDEEEAEKEGEKIGASLSRASQEIKEERDVEAMAEESGKELSPKEKQIVKKALGFAGNLLDSQETTVEGNIVKTTFVFGKKQLNTLQFLLNMAKAFQQKEQKKQQRQEALEPSDEDK